MVRRDEVGAHGRGGVLADPQLLPPKRPGLVAGVCVPELPALAGRSSRVLHSSHGESRQRDGRAPGPRSGVVLGAAAGVAYGIWQDHQDGMGPMEGGTFWQAGGIGMILGALAWLALFQ